ncbi:hypothetical protein A3D01_04965 [Candidatus Woesebacteria bacterium RIFCSPHIGHO2_02_FULL_39_13]|uniref:UDP-N-acetylglucosamine 2-epimerase domain-containing protein n=1 Tax=Candidatus Woesebacteria bacterium RIFCSPHIGHO2_02_FULL_39_13 TaxID=1802505 RepID=A0A1F7Z1Q3_9BACT|nr:MAG: hypothetical protein A2692_00285 [Candidatus Woesebacteria bacterium RIFCSPHIGHO2_01_FULL_39_95]OGM32898.1 MAG: hypothetical protein A3D01_04965 [Candidatus Woesebacteria bacterium RIFCSPHIGHO2_02_FULL_39_13]OGM74411.1 MAG: hypothetical protein A3H19_05275 [Candidatus Woesebacteria bacterium RIFCSPLOWO2_12_FULL_39_9]
MRTKTDKIFYFFIGTTAELIKIAPVIHEFQKRNIVFKIITSGQNKINFEDLTPYTGAITSYISLREKVNKSSGILFAFWAIGSLYEGMMTLRKEISSKKRRKSYLIVHGDTVSALIGSLIAKILGIRLVHVESGLYSHNYLEPFPEEICRNIIDRISNVLFPSSHWALKNVKDCRGTKIMTKQNTLIECFLWAINAKHVSNNINKLKGLKKYYVLTMHRQEHVMFKKGWSKKIMEFVLKNAPEDLNCVLLNHPLTHELIKSLKLNKKITKKIILIPRLPYQDYLMLMKNAQFIATDSCINQLEAYYLGLPYLGLRNYTEQPEGLGKNVTICKGNYKLMKSFLTNYKNYKQKPILLKKDYTPSKIIVGFLLKD